MASLERDIKLLEEELNRFREQSAAIERDRRCEVTRQGDQLKSQERQMKERVCIVCSVCSVYICQASVFITA